jgi:hypothetical protein
MQVTKTSHLPIRYLLALLWAHPILHVSRIRVKCWMYGRRIQPIEWREISKAIQNTFFMLNWNTVLGRFTVTNGNAQSPQLNFCHAVKISSSVEVYIQGISVNNFIKVEFASAKKWTKLFLMLERFYSCTDILHTKRETLFAYNFRN